MGFYYLSMKKTKTIKCECGKRLEDTIFYYYFM